MSSLSQTAVNAHAAATPVPTVVATPSATPVVHAALTHAAVHLSLVSSLTNWLTAHQLLLVGVLGALLVVAQNFLNKFPFLKADADKVNQMVQDLKREVVAFGLPGLVVAVWSLTQGSVPPTWWLEWLQLYAAGKAIFNGVKLSKVAVQKAAVNVKSAPSAPAAPLG